MNPCVLFVDDEQNLLDGLRRMLGSMRGKWNMIFVSSGPAALKILETESIQAIVTDIRMPEMDGVQLLRIVHKRFPGLVRIILSGYSDFKLAVQTTNLAHQFLSKPCDSRELITILEQSFRLAERLQQPELHKIIAQIERVPCLPALYQNVMAELTSTDCSLERVTMIVADDIGMSAKLLQLVNSNYFGNAPRVTELKQALQLLGIELMQSLALSIKIFGEAEDCSDNFGNLNQLWRHSRLVGSIARIIDESVNQDKDSAETAYTAGLLHDLGILIVTQNMRESARRIQQLLLQQNDSIWNAEFEVLGTTHGEIGGYLLGLWGLPDEIVDAVSFHHRPSKQPSRAFSTLTATHLADGLAYELLHENTPNEHTKLDWDYLTETGVMNQLDDYRQLVRTQVDLREFA